eukprot:CAMPEP_0181289306 /NCGR_PEP_ID=MMETSP1101-20121128/815_1 /TAXON_ID=46948 /ORGANISM="Rhodomonas abbreviata, Strain Caron Lab Isolate" /LENGTH=252 /DNA_ID=CAMNT_0023393525 /DNA_START=320 /DNA_END=1074 /DNA_ORIENTATION=+
MQDPNKETVSRAWQTQDGFDPSQMGGMKRGRDDEVEEDEYDDKGDGSRSKYKCGLCGQPKKGHSCSAHKAAAEQFWGTRYTAPNPTFASVHPAYSMNNKRMVLISKLRERLERRVFGVDNGSSHARFVQPPFPMQHPGMMDQMYAQHPGAAGMQADPQAGGGGYYQWAGQYQGQQPGQPGAQAVQNQAQQQQSASGAGMPGNGLYPWMGGMMMQPNAQAGGSFPGVGPYAGMQQYADGGQGAEKEQAEEQAT